MTKATLTFGDHIEDCQTAYTTRGDSADPLTSPSCTVQKGGYFRIQGTSDNPAAVEQVYYRSADLTSKAISTATYDKWLLRFRTNVASGGLGVKVIVEDTDSVTEIIYGSTPEYSATWKTASGTFGTVTKDLKYIYFYAAEDAADNSNGTYYVEYDFLLILEDTFTFPSISEGLTVNVKNRYVDIEIPGRRGDITQYLGAASPEIVLTGKIQDDTGWGSPLLQRLFNIQFHSDEQTWQWFTSDLISCKVTLRDLTVTQNREAQRVWTATFKTYDEYDASADWVWEYYGFE